MLSVLLSALIKQGSLRVIWPDGKSETFGLGSPHAAIRLSGRWTALALALQPELAVGEAYMDGRLTAEDCDIEDVLRVLVLNSCEKYPPFIMRTARRVRHLWRWAAQFNSPYRARRNVAHHYDLSEELYALFLDADRQYSCAYYESPDISLENAQKAKKQHIAAKLYLHRPGLKVLEIGSGWGGLALELCNDYAADVQSITLSAEQWKVCKRRAEAAGLAERCRFDLRDYRTVKGRFDRIVSIAMFEAVGLPYYHLFFQKLGDLLNEDGVVLLHTIGYAHEPSPINPWLNKYIFPGSHAPSLSELLPATERAGLYVTDIEILRLHYAETLKAWRTRFRANWDKAAALYDERFCRMWDFYLTGCEVSFRLGYYVIFQIQLAKRMDSLPVTRDYMVDLERAIKNAAGDGHFSKVA